MEEIFEKKKREIIENRNVLCRCPFCNGSIKDRPITIYEGLIDCLFRVYQWCGEKGRHEFKTKEIKHLMGKNEYARFGDLIMFEGLVYKARDTEGIHHKGDFGLNMNRTRMFFANEYKIPVQIIVNQITGEILNATYVGVGSFPKLVELLDKNGLYDYDKKVKVTIDWKKQAEAGMLPVQTDLGL